MNCNDTMAALTTGGPLRRRQARRHAAHCPRCAAALAFLGDVSRDLSALPDLTPEQRQVWLEAADAAPAAPAKRRSSPRRTALVGAGVLAAAAALIFALVATHQPERPGDDRPIANIPRAEIPSPDPATLQHLDAMRAELDAAERDLADLARKADLLDARRQTDLLLAEYGPPPDHPRTL
jgi:hypothetical protein